MVSKKEMQEINREYKKRQPSFTRAAASILWDNDDKYKSYYLHRLDYLWLSEESKALINHAIELTNKAYKNGYDYPVEYWWECFITQYVELKRDELFLDLIYPVYEKIGVS